MVFGGKQKHENDFLFRVLREGTQGVISVIQVRDDEELALVA